MGGKAVLWVSWSDTKLVIWVPYDATDGTISVTTPHGVITSPAPFNLNANAPTLRSFSPTSAPIHANVTLFGDRLKEASRVTIGGVDAPIRESSASQVRVEVPDNAVTGKLEVTTPGGTDKAPDDFTVTSGAGALPEITRMEPPKGLPGTTVTLTGTGFTDVTTVSFPGATATRTVVDDTRIDTVVPPGATTGRITLFVRTNSHSVTSRDLFEVTSAPSAPPVITSFTPESGPPGTRVELKGSGFDGVTETRLGVQKTGHFKWYDHTLIVYLPIEGAATGTISVTTPAGTGHSAKQFIVNHGVPEITDFTPASGRAGTPVIIRGRKFNDLQSVTFGIMPVSSVLSASATELRVLVPEGATTGSIRVRTLGGTATSSTFRVTTAGFATRATVGIEAAYITQSIQRMDGSVPLVAGRDGMLRVFLQANADNGAAPSVRAKILDARGNDVFTGDIPPPRSGVPTEIREFVLEDSWNLPIPGARLQPGNTILLELLPGPADTSVDIPVRTYPASGAPRTLDIRPVPPLRITLIPVYNAGTVGNVERDGRSREDWLTRVKQYYPVKDVEVTVAQPFTAPEPLLADFSGYTRLRDTLEATRVLQSSRRLSYWYGVFVLPRDAGTTGLGAFGEKGGVNNRAAIGWDGAGPPDGQNCFNTFAHELGHNFHRYHAPCGSAGGPDENFPYARGTIGVYGFNVQGSQIKTPSTDSDVMGYCYPRWVSDYTYEAVMNFRNWELMRPPIAAEVHGVGEQVSLLVWGTIDEGKVAWRPSFTSPVAPALPIGGDYTLECRDAHGKPLMQPIPFEAEPIADLPTRRDFRSFVFMIPMTPAMLAGPFTLHVLKGGHRLPETAPFLAPGSAMVHRLTPPREPVAKQWRPGVVHLSWDHGAYPGVEVKDPHTHDILTIASGGSIEIATEATELECVFSISATATGERSVTRLVKVEK
jgi:hypothetical protein